MEIIIQKALDIFEKDLGNSDISEKLSGHPAVFNHKPSGRRSHLYIPKINADYVLKSLENSREIDPEMEENVLSNEQLTELTWLYLQKYHKLENWYAHLQNLHQNSMINPKNLDSFIADMKESPVSYFELKRNDARMIDNALTYHVHQIRRNAVRALQNAGLVITSPYPGGDTHKIVKIHPAYQ